MRNLTADKQPVIRPHIWLIALGIARAFGRARDGSVAATTAMALVAIIGMAALAIDLGQAYNATTEFNNAADASALAGATQLDQTPGACLRAIAAATNANLTNEETFASNAGGPDIFIDPTPDPIANANIRFLSDLVKDANGILIGDYITIAADCDSTAEYIEVTVDRASLAAGDDYRVNFSLAPIVGVSEALPIGYAVAGLGSAYCGVAPMMMCELSPLPDGAGSLSFWDDLNARPETYRGRGVYLKSGDNSSQWGSGDFGFLALEGAIKGGGSKQLQEAIGAVDPPLFCLGLEGLTTEPGASSGARKGFNTRFDIWMGDISSERGNVRYQPSANTVKGWMHNSGSSCAWADWSQPVIEYTGPGSYDLSALPGSLPADAAMPPPMDDCAYPWTPANPTGGDCDGSEADNSDRMRVTGLGAEWDIDTYLAVNQYGMTEIQIRTDLGLLPGDPLTRYMVYKWEMGYNGAYGPGDYGHVGPAHYLVDNIGAEATDAAGILPIPLDSDPSLPNHNPLFLQPREYGGAQCYTGPMGDVGVTVKEDRRVINVAVVDCESQVIQGKTNDVTALGFIKFFVLTPWRVNGSVHEIYAEILEPVVMGVDKVIAKTVVQLYE